MAPSIDCHSHWMPWNSSYSVSPCSQSFSHTPACVHSWKRAWAVELLQMPVAFNAFHWHPVFRTNRMAFIAARSSTRGRPRPQGSVRGCGGSNGWILAQRASEIRHRLYNTSCAIGTLAKTGCLHAMESGRESFSDRL